MNNTKPHRGWIASLSTGETIFEYKTGRGEISAWQQLLQRCESSNVRITQMRLQRSGITITCIPNAQGYFQAKEIKISNRTRSSVVYQGIGSISKDHVFITWIDDQGNLFHDVRPLGDVWVHTDKRKTMDIL